MSQEENKDENNQANEPVSKYGMELRFFNSFEEANEADAREVAQFSPVEHLQHATSMIKKIFAKELKKEMDLTIHFK